METKMRRFKLVDYPNPPKRIHIIKLKDPLIETKIAQNLEERMQNIGSSYRDEEKRIAMKTALLETQTEDIGFQTQTKRQTWKTDEILKLMEERREHFSCL